MPKYPYLPTVSHGAGELCDHRMGFSSRRQIARPVGTKGCLVITNEQSCIGCGLPYEEYLEESRSDEGHHD
jgi:hypothetical protein